MSHTNSTTNYNLPQFVGTDKPAWLTDINGAFSAIDTAVKAASDAATTAGSDATTANTSIGTLANLNTTEKTNLVGAINEVNTATGTAQETANTAIGTANSTSTALNTFMQKFNLTNISQGTDTYYAKTGTVDNNMTLAQNSDGSIFKAYGNFRVHRNSSARSTQVQGLNLYGIDTGLVLTTAPSTAYVIKCAGHETWINPDNGSTQWSAEGKDIAVGTNGHIYIAITTGQATWSGNASYEIDMIFPPCIYFNASFGDDPTPTPNA